MAMSPCMCGSVCIAKLLQDLRGLLCTHITETVAGSHSTTINFQPSDAQCEICLCTTFQGGTGGLG